MRLTFQTSGGLAHIPGLAAPRTIDGDALDPATRETLANLIRDADFFHLPARTPAPPGAADHHTYQISCEEAGRRHTIRVSDPIGNPALQRLVQLLQTL